LDIPCAHLSRTYLGLLNPRVDLTTSWSLPCVNKQAQQMNLRLAHSGAKG
jgi:hypothetical protein